MIIPLKFYLSTLAFASIGKLMEVDALLQSRWDEGCCNPVDQCDLLSWPSPKRSLEEAEYSTKEHTWKAISFWLKPLGIGSCNDRKWLRFLDIKNDLRFLDSSFSSTSKFGFPKKGLSERMDGMAQKDLYMLMIKMRLRVSSCNIIRARLSKFNKFLSQWRTMGSFSALSLWWRPDKKKKKHSKVILKRVRNKIFIHITSVKSESVPT